MPDASFSVISRKCSYIPINGKWNDFPLMGFHFPLMGNQFLLMGNQFQLMGNTDFLQGWSAIAFCFPSKDCNSGNQKN